jgi:hypothetical protein
MDDNNINSIETRTDVDANRGDIRVVSTIERVALYMSPEGVVEIADDLSPLETKQVLKALGAAVFNMGRTEQKFRSTLKECAEQFDYYAKGHRKKEASAQTEDAALTAGGKATTNEALAYHIRDLLAETRRTPETITEVVV